MPVNFKLQAQQRAILAAQKTASKKATDLAPANSFELAGQGGAWTQGDLDQVIAGKIGIYYTPAAVNSTRYGKAHEWFMPVNDSGNMIYAAFKQRNIRPTLATFNQQRAIYVDQLNRAGHLSDNMTLLSIALSVVGMSGVLAPAADAGASMPLDATGAGLSTAPVVAAPVTTAQTLGTVGAGTEATLTGATPLFGSSTSLTGDIVNGALAGADIGVTATQAAGYTVASTGTIPLSVSPVDPVVATPPTTTNPLTSAVTNAAGAGATNALNSLVGSAIAHAKGTNGTTPTPTSAGVSAQVQSPTPADPLPILGALALLMLSFW